MKDKIQTISGTSCRESRGRCDGIDKSDNKTNNEKYDEEAIKREGKANHFKRRWDRTKNKLKRRQSHWEQHKEDDQAENRPMTSIGEWFQGETKWGNE